MKKRTGLIISIGRKDPIYQVVRFVLKAKGGNGISVHPLHCLFSGGEEICCSDGHRFHAAKLKIPTGLYEVPINNKTEILLVATEGCNFPDYKKLEIPEREKSGKVFYDTRFPYVDYAVATKALPDGCYMQYKYFIDVLCISPSMAAEKGKPIAFYGAIGSAECYAAIMPIKID